MDAPALLKREGLVAVRLGAEKASDLIEDATETCGGGEGFEPRFCRKVAFSGILESVSH
jgi:hypothetical protein